MDHLLRPLAPISDSGWHAIEDRAKQLLGIHLAARKLVDFDGPHGWPYAAVPSGRTEPAADGDHDVHVALRGVLPLAEVRVPFRVARSELAAIDRGAKDVELDDLDRAAQRRAHPRTGRRALSRLDCQGGRRPAARRDRGALWPRRQPRRLHADHRDSRTRRLPPPRPSPQDPRWIGRLGAGHRGRARSFAPRGGRLRVRLRSGHRDRLRRSRYRFGTALLRGELHLLHQRAQRSDRTPYASMIPANRGSIEDPRIDVVVETPMRSRNKYEYDAAIGMIRLDRRLPS